MTDTAAAGPPRVGVVIPVRSFRGAMSRLAPALAPDERAALARDLADRVRAAAGDLPVVIVTGDAEVIAWAEAGGCATCPDPGTLDGAAAAGQEWTRAAGFDRFVVAHADLPRVASFAAVIGDGAAPVAVVVPDHRDDGTPVLSLPTAAPFAFAYGPGSAARHIAAARAAGLTVRVLSDPYLGFDVDLAADLVTLDSERPVP